MPAADRLTLGLATVRDLAGVALDGEWADGADAYPSGDDHPGGPFRFTVNVLAADADRRGGRVNALDLSEVRRRLNSTTASNVGAGYSIFADIDGSGTINALGLTVVRRNLNRSLPPPPVPAQVLGLSDDDAGSRSGTGATDV